MSVVRGGAYLPQRNQTPVGQIPTQFLTLPQEGPTLTVHFQPRPGLRRFFGFKDLSLPPASRCDICNHNLSLILVPMSTLALDNSMTLNEGWHIWLKPPGRGRQGSLKLHLTLSLHANETVG